MGAAGGQQMPMEPAARTAARWSSESGEDSGRGWPRHTSSLSSRGGHPWAPCDEASDLCAEPSLNGGPTSLGTALTAPIALSAHRVLLCSKNNLTAPIIGAAFDSPP